MKKQTWGIPVLGAVLLLLTGCGNNSSTTQTSYTQRTLSGTLNLSSNARFSPQSLDIDKSNYMIWFQNIGSRRVYFTDLDENGDFSLPIETTSDLSNGDHFMAVLISKDPFVMVGTIMGEPDNGDTESATGLQIAGNVANLEIEFDPTKARATLAPENLPDNLVLDEDFEVRLDDEGKPKGFDHAGKSDESKLTGSETASSTHVIDKDGDGRPDIFDAMNDGRNLDNATHDAALETTVFSDSLAGLTMFMNLKIAQSDEETFDVGDDSILVIDVAARDPNDISSIKAYLLNDNYKTGTLDKIPSGMTAVDTWGAEGSLWSDDDYKLYKVLNQNGDPRWTVLFHPNNNDFAPGDLILLQVTLTDGSFEYYWTSFNFKFEHIPFETSTWSLGGDGSRENPYIIPATGNITLNWEAPTDETGTELEGLTYQFETFHYDGDTPENQIGDRQVVDLGDDVFTGELTDTVIDANDSDPDLEMMQLDITASYPQGDNTAIKVYLKRDGW